MPHLHPVSFLSYLFTIFHISIFMLFIFLRLIVLTHFYLFLSINSLIFPIYIYAVYFPSCSRLPSSLSLSFSCLFIHLYIFFVSLHLSIYLHPSLFLLWIALYCRFCYILIRLFLSSHWPGFHSSDSWYAYYLLCVYFCLFYSCTIQDQVATVLNVTQNFSV